METYHNYINLLLENLEEDLVIEDKKDKEDDEEQEVKKSSKDSFDDIKDIKGYISAKDMKTELNHFIGNSYVDKLAKYKALYKFLSELNLQLVSKINEFDEKGIREGETDFFELFYEILKQSLKNNKGAFLDTYLEAVSIINEEDDNIELLENVEDEKIKDIDNKNNAKDIDLFKGLSDEQKEEIRDLPEEDKRKLLDVLGNGFKKSLDYTANNDLLRVGLVQSLTDINPALGFLSNVILGINEK